MSRADYAHWNEDADYMWWHEEGKHAEYHQNDPRDYDDDYDGYYEDHPPEGCE